MKDKLRVPGSQVFFTLLFVCLFVVKGRCEVYRSLHWTPDNPIFMTNTTQCVDGEFPQMNVLPDSTIHVLCPTVVTVLETVQSIKPKQNLIENLWITYDKESFETCNVNTTNAVLDKKRNRPLMECNKPLELKYFTIVFQQFSAVGGGLEFTPGKDYYFLATSDGTVESLNNTAGGHCNDTKNGVSMRFKVYVCKGENDQQCTQSKPKLGTFYCGKITTPLMSNYTVPVLASSLTPSTSEMLCPTAAHTVLVNQTMCANSSTLGKVTVMPSSASACVSTTITEVVNHTMHACTSVNNLSPSQPSVRPLNQELTTVCPTITHTRICYTVCGASVTVKPSPSDTSSAVVLSPRTTVSSVIVGSELTTEKPCPECELGKREAQQASSKDKGTWMPLAIFFICSCVLLLLAVGIYVKFFKKHAYKVNPSTDKVNPSTDKVNPSTDVLVA